jgi:hypothetical protein
MGLSLVGIPLYFFVLTHDLIPKSLQLFGIMLYRVSRGDVPNIVLNARLNAASDS